MKPVWMVSAVPAPRPSSENGISYLDHDFAVFDTGFHPNPEGR
jgi:hypothetical protein